MKILVVDDEPGFRMLLEDFFGDIGWQVISAENGEEGLQFLREQQFDAIISDIYMPVMDGLKFHREIRNGIGNKSLPFIFVSSYADQYTLDAIKSPKVDAFVRKGNPPEEIRKWVEYLTTPENKRPGTLPNSEASPPSAQFRRDRSGISRR